MAFAIVFLPQMPHGSFLLDGFILMCPILLTITFVFTRFAFRTLLSSALFQVLNIFCCPAIVRAIKTKSSACNISCNVPSFISSEQHQSQWQTTVVIKLIPDVLHRLPLTLLINVLELSSLSLHLYTGSSLLQPMLQEFIFFSLPIPRHSSELCQMLFPDLQRTCTTSFVWQCM